MTDREDEPTPNGGAAPAAASSAELVSTLNDRYRRLYRATLLARRLRPRGLAALRAYLPLLAVSAVVLALGALVTPLTRAYCAIVLEVKDSDALLMPREGPPFWRRVEAAPGDYVCKQTWSSTPILAPLPPANDRLRGLYQRYASSYDGIVAEVRRPVLADSSAVVLIDSEGLGRIAVDLFGQPRSAALRPGLRLTKRAGAWDPIVGGAP